jgi:hypothetical protein
MLLNNIESLTTGKSKLMSLHQSSVCKNLRFSVIANTISFARAAASTLDVVIVGSCRDTCLRSFRLFFLVMLRLWR